MASTVKLRDRFVFQTTADTIVERRKLRRQFGRFDMVFYLVCTIIVLDTLGAVASHGAEAFTWLVILGVFFFVPYALVTAELGSAFPVEGGPYVWTRLAFGRLVAIFVVIIYWIDNPIVLGGLSTITAITVARSFFLSLEGFWYYLFALAFIWSSVLAAIIAFRIGKWVPTLGGWIRSALLIFVTFSVGLYALHNGIQGFGVGAFGPTYLGFIALIPVLLFNLVGFEVPTGASEEMINPEKDIPRTIRTAGVTSIALYAIPILAILIVLPRSRIAGLSGFIDTIKTVFTIYGGRILPDGSTQLHGMGAIVGDLAAAAFIVGILTSGTAWFMGADRCLAIACADGGGPRFLGRFSDRFGTPVAANVLSGVVATATMVLATTVTSGGAAQYFGLGIGVALSVSSLAYVFILPTVIKLRYSHPYVRRPFRIPGSNSRTWLIAGVATLWMALGTVLAVWPGIGAANPEQALPHGISRIQFEAAQGLVLLMILALSLASYGLGRAARTRIVSDAVGECIEPPGTGNRSAVGALSREPPG